MIIVVGIGADGMAGLASARCRTALSHSRLRFIQADRPARRQRGRTAAPLAVADAARAGTPARRQPARGRSRGGQWRSDVARHRHVADPVARRPPGPGAAARVLGDAGLCPAGLGRAGHRGDQPGHRLGAHRGAPRRQAVVLSRDAATPAELARLLTETGRGASEFTVLELLGGPTERIRSRAADAWAAAPPADVDDLNVVAVRYLPDDRVSQTLPDDAFLHDGQITKQTVRAVTLAALAPRPGQLLWDVGSGSGSIAVEWCRAETGCRAVASETSPQRCERITANSRAFGVEVESAVRRPRTSTARHPGCDIHRRRADPTRPGVRLYRPAGTGRTAGGQRRHRGIRSPAGGMAHPARRRTAPLPASPPR